MKLSKVNRMTKYDSYLVAFIQQIFISTYYLPGPSLSAGDNTMEQGKQHPYSCETHSSEERQIIKK